MRRRNFVALTLGVALASLGCQPRTGTPQRPAESPSEPPREPARDLGEGITTIYLVRHAEKVITPDDPDPPLSEAGRTRAAALPGALGPVRLDVIYSSDYQRTRDTVAAVADKFGLKVELYDPGDASAFAATLRTHTGAQVLVAGHSNTIPALLAELGVAAPVVIANDQYGDLFVVTTRADGDAELEVRHYGAE